MTQTVKMMSTCNKRMPLQQSKLTYNQGKSNCQTDECAQSSALVNLMNTCMELERGYTYTVVDLLIAIHSHAQLNAIITGVCRQTVTYNTTYIHAMILARDMQLSLRKNLASSYHTHT